MTVRRGSYSGSGKDPLPARGSFVEDSKQDSDKQPQPKQPDYAGGMSAPKPRYPLQGD